MKKYKLIKEYPGSPELGHIAEYKDDGKWYHHFLPKLRDDDDLNSIGRHEITLYSEFWELVEEKEYEILSFKDNYSTLILEKTGKIFKATNRDYGHHDTFENLIDNTFGWSIHSVKRLCDGKVFTIGDNCFDGLIERFEFDGFNQLRAVFKILNIGETQILLKNLVKQKTPLFTTEDGVDIFEDDNYYLLSNRRFDFIAHSGTGNKYIFTATKNTPVKNELNTLRFSTKEAAEEYILMHKPCLSINDIKSLNNLKPEFRNLNSISITKTNLIKLVKSKL